MGKVGLALGGGSARGLAHIGILKFFWKRRSPSTWLWGQVSALWWARSGPQGVI
jgi:predicted acylesterase/phospholipase RssA